jgi:hypothetical protein
VLAHVGDEAPGPGLWIPISHRTLSPLVARNIQSLHAQRCHGSPARAVDAPKQGLEAQFQAPAPTASAVMSSWSMSITARSLRIKLQNDYRHPRFIATVPGKGYRFIPTFSNEGWGTPPDPGGVHLD